MAGTMSQLGTWARVNLLFLWPLVAAVLAITVVQTTKGDKTGSRIVAGAARLERQSARLGKRGKFRTIRR